jgi:hypothetical protein
VSHPRLVDLDWSEIEFEMQNSKSEIENRLGSLVSALAYPYAFPQADREFVSRFCQLLQVAGYECCVTTDVGCVQPGDDRLRLRRLPANSADDRAFFLAKLTGAYDWLGRVQSLSKRLRHKRMRREQTPPFVTQQALG